MSRILLYCILFTCCLSIRGWGQENYSVMDWNARNTVRTHLLQEMHHQYDLRRDAIQEALQSKENMLAYRDACRQRYLEMLGKFPEKTPLNPLVTRIIEQDGYRIENVLYESMPDHHVTANFYLPAGEGPFPAAIMFCGHEMTSKSSESYHKIGSLFALNGFAALVVDPVSQGERVQFTDSSGERILRGSTTEHTLLNAGANLVGTGVVNYELYDNIRSLDYLLSRPEVDTGRVGCVGNSGGGTQATYFVAFDERVKVAAPCSYIARRERNWDLVGANDGCQHIPGEGEALLEIADFLIMFAPKPTLILAGRYDFVDYTGTEQSFAELRSVYSALGETDKIDLFTVDDGHGISRPKREAAVRWLKRWLADDNPVVKEPDLKALGEEELNCTPGGQVNAMFPGERNIQDLNLAKGRELGASRIAFAKSHDLDGYQKQIRKLLAIDHHEKEINAELKGHEKNELFQLKKYILRKEGEVPLPCLVYVPSQLAADPNALVYVMEEGKSSMAMRDSLVQSSMQQGDLLIMADIRSTGETLEREDANEWKYYNRDYTNAMISLHLGKSIIGQQVTDLITLLDFIDENDFGKELPVRLYASGATGPVAIYAALFRPQVKSIQVSNSIRSYVEILDHPMELDWYSYVIFNVLAYFDLPDLMVLREDLDISFQGEKSRIRNHKELKNKRIR